MAKTRMTKTQAEPDLSREERRPWVEPELVVVSLKEAMTSPNTSAVTDGPINYS